MNWAGGGGLVDWARVGAGAGVGWMAAQHRHGLGEPAVAGHGAGSKAAAAAKDGATTVNWESEMVMMLDHWRRHGPEHD